MNFVVLSSSRGTTFQAVIEAINRGTVTSQCLGLITDRVDRGCVEKARAANLPVIIVEKKKGEEREAYDDRLHEAIVELGGQAPDPTTSPAHELTIIACIGWMFLLSRPFVHAWHKRIVNVHPSLLPKYPGAHGISDALLARETTTGMTIHWIDEGLDTGKIIVQKSCSIEKEDTQETLKEKVQALEKEWYPKVLGMLERGEIAI